MKASEMDTEKVELKGCPFPHGITEFDDVDEQAPYATSNGVQGHFVECAVCGCAGPSKDSEAEAIAAWNRRSPVPDEVREAYREAIDAIHGDLGLFKMAIEMEDPKQELLQRVKMLQEHIDRALKENNNAG